ncbi:hypothetical protein [Sporosarcina sp. SAFN-010]|uniref:hypothetical protein n=1 Tax=Sporosarcina sp. SAFN-010 TaxID=3387273 RepID=UPI003F80FFF2
MNITKADELKELSESGRVEFEKGVLEGPFFKNILGQMEEAALKGYSGFEKTIYDTEEIRELKVIQKAFLDAGYECKFEFENHKNLLGLSYTTRKFVVDWNKK